MELIYKGRCNTSDMRLKYYKFNDLEGKMYYTKMLRSEEPVFLGSPAVFEGGDFKQGILNIIGNQYFLAPSAPSPYFVGV